MEKQVDRCCVIDFVKARKGLGRTYSCDCKAVSIHEETQLIECNHCGQMWTCYEWLRHILRNDWWLKLNTAELRKEAQELQAEVADLKSKRNYQRKKVAEGK